MRKVWLCSIVAATALLATGCSSLSKFDVWRIATDGRDGWQHPEDVIEALGIAPGDRVAEIGAGSGYWIERLSGAVGPEGRVYAVEVTDELVAGLEDLATRRGLTNVEVVRGEFEDPGLPRGEIDLAITCLTYHHIEDRIVYFRNLRRSLSPNGRVAHLDDRDDLRPPLRWLPTKGHWSNVREMSEEMREAGYARTESFDFLPLQSFQTFEPIDRAAVPAATAQRAP